MTADAAALRRHARRPRAPRRAAQAVDAAGVRQDRRPAPPRCELVTEAGADLRAPGCGAAFVNADARGYYFTEYEPAAVAALATRTPPLTAAERISLLGDEWRMVRAGRHDVGTYLDLAAAFASDETPAVLERPGRRASATCAAPSPTPAQRAAFEAWIRARVRPRRSTPSASSRAPGDTDDVLQPPRHAAAAARRPGWRHGAAGSARARWPTATWPTRRRCRPRWSAPVLQVAAAGGDAALYDRYLAEDAAVGRTPDEYYRFFNALPAFHDPALVAAHAGASRSRRGAVAGRAVAASAQLLGRRHGDAAWAFVKARVGRAHGQARHVPGHPLHRRRARRVLFGRARRPRSTAFFDGAPRAGGRAGAAAGARAHRQLRGRRRRASRRRSAAWLAARGTSEARGHRAASAQRDRSSALRPRPALHLGIGRAGRGVPIRRSRPGSGGR